MDDGGMIRRHLGIDERMPPIEAAVTVARSIPIRGGRRADETSETDSLEHGWLSIAACAEVLCELCDARSTDGEAFSGRWPWLEVGGVILAPGLPVAVGVGEEEGPDGAYRRQDQVIVREAAGREKSHIELAPPAVDTQPELDLLWFNEMARFRLSKAVVEIEDLFSRTCLPATQRCLERWLVREMRRPPEILDGIGFATGDGGRQTLEIRRRAAVTDRGWSDPEAFLSARADIAGITCRGAELVVRTVTDEETVFRLQEQSMGWTARRHEGKYIFDEIVVRKDDGDVLVTVVPSQGKDLASAALRARLTFDLSSDLVALGAPQIS